MRASCAEQVVAGGELLLEVGGQLLARAPALAKLCSPSRMVDFRPPIARSAISVAVISSEMVARSDVLVGLEQPSCLFSRTQ